MENDISILASWFAVTPATSKNEAINDIDSIPDTLFMNKHAFIAQLWLLINNMNSDLFTAGYPKNSRALKYNN